MLTVLAGCTGTPGELLKTPGTPLAEAARDGATDAGTNDGGTCASDRESATEYLRHLSMSLRGSPPTRVELEAVRASGDVSAAQLDAMIQSPEFLDQVRLWHRALLWPNIDQFKVRAAGLVAVKPGTGNGFYRDTQQLSPDPALIGPDRARYADYALSIGTGNDSMGEQRGSNYPGHSTCDSQLEYPDPATSGPQPTYVGADGQQHAYYDADGVPNPYFDAKHCPNYCMRDTADGTRFDDFADQLTPGAEAVPHFLDRPGQRCAPGFHRLINPCKREPPATQFSTYDGRRFELDHQYRKDGYRMIEHYWSKGIKVKTCAYEAQDRMIGLRDGSSCAAPGTNLSWFGHDATCGCGPQGRFCMPYVPGYNTELESRSISRFRTALNEEPIRIIRSVVEADEDYFDIFRTRRAQVNGALAYAYRYQTESFNGSSDFRFSPPAAQAAIPDLPFEEDEWHDYQRGPEAAGILTTPVYNLRFATWRARVTQFRQAFMCRPFLPATNALPAPGDTCSLEPNLARRCGCQGCHAALEPLGAFFGRWAERSPEYLSPTAFPSKLDECINATVDAHGYHPPHCAQYVRTGDDTGPEGVPQRGMLKAYLYRTAEEAQRIDIGPSGLAELGEQSGELQTCTVRTTWKRLVGREMTEEEEANTMPALVKAFNDSGHRYKALVRDIVTHPAFRKVN